MPFVQTKFAQYATKNINEKYGTDINIERLQFSLISWEAAIKNIYIADHKKDTLFHVKELNTSILDLKNLYSGKLEFGHVAIDVLTFKLKTYYGEKDTNLDVFVEKVGGRKPRKKGTPPFFLSATDVGIEHSKFKVVDENLENPAILNFGDLSIGADSFQILGPEVTLDVNALSFKGKRGINVEDLTTSFSYTPKQMRFDTLNLKTNKSNLKGDLVFNYIRSDFADFINKVQLDAQFNESVLSFDEINLFYNEFGEDKEAIFSSKVTGTLNDLNAEELLLHFNNSGVRGNFNFKNLFNKQKSAIVNANMRNLTSSYYELRSLMPRILGNSIPKTIEKLGQFTLRGDAVITETSIQTKANINTAVGSSYLDLEITDFDNINEATYKGFVSLIDFDLGEFIDNRKLGETTLDFNVDGKGFVRETLNTEVIGEVYSVNFNNYEYKNVKVSGVLKEQLFDGFLSTNDDNLQFSFTGLADFTAERNDFNFIADVDYANLKALNFITDSISIFKGNINMDIAGNSLDNIVGDIKFSQTNYQNKNDTYYFDDFKVSSIFENDSIRNIEINSPDIITGYVRGNFKVRELGELMRNSIGSIYTNYRPFEISEGQQLDFNFKIYNKIVDVFVPEINFGPNTFIRGTIAADDGDFKLTFKSPRISAFGNNFENIDLKIDNKNPLFNTYVSVNNVSTAYYDVQNFSLINTTLKDTLFFRTEFKGGSEYNDNYNLNFYHTFNNDGKSVIGLKKSEVSFKGNTWVLNRNGNRKNKVVFNETLDSIVIEEIVMNNNVNEQIRLQGQLADSTYKDLNLQFKIVSLDKIIPSIKGLKLDGKVNGTLNVFQKDNIYLPSCNLGVEDFSINDSLVGDLAIGIVGNRDLTDYVINTHITQDGIEKFSVLGNISNKNDNPKANLLANFQNFSLEPFAPLGEEIISNIRGEANGSVKISGDLKSLGYNGLLTLNDAGLGVPYLNVDYGFASYSRVRLYGQTFSFENVYLTDVAEGTHAVIDGTISHNNFKDWSLNLDVDTNNDRFLILNTDYDEGALYYGAGFLNGTGRIFGSTKALTITVDGATGAGTSLKIPISDVATVGDYSFITFLEKNDVKTIEEERVLDDYQGLEMEFNFDITPEAEVEIVIDQKTGTSLKGTGVGLMLMQINTKGKFNMFGEFVAVTGEYHHKFGILDKTFDVKPGGIIYWQGSPLEAQLNMEAVYSLNANPAPLLDNASYTRRIPTDVVIKLSGELESPKIAFNVEFPGTNSIIKSELEYRMQDPTFEERNAFFLLAQGTFVNEDSGLNQQAITGNLIQTASSLLNQVLGGDNDKFDFNLSYEQGDYVKSADILTENRIGVTVSTKISDRIFFNGKLGVPVGGVSETVVAGDVEVQFLLNEEGTLSAKIFNRENEIRQFLADTQGYTQGGGISYEVDFNHFEELINKIFKKKDKKSKVTLEKTPDASGIMGKDNLIQFSEVKDVPK